MSARLYPFEAIALRAGFPTLEYRRDGLPGRPLIVFVTGGGLSARISHGHPEGRERDFLAYWIRAAGYPFLALSYPLGHPLFPTVHPDFSVRDWGDQAAESIAAAVDAQHLPREVVILAWSMAGRIAVPLATALKRRGCDIELFVAMVATPPFGFLPPLEALRQDEDGLADVSGRFTDWLVTSLAEQGAHAGRVLVPEPVFRRDFTGNVPVGLVACSLRWKDSTFVSDPGADLADTRALDYASYPPIASMTHADAGDARHALTDAPAWAFAANQALQARHLAACQSRLAELPAQAWHRLLDRMRSATRELSAVLAGNHLFFVGEDHARATVTTMERMLTASRETRARIEGLLVELKL